MATLTEVRCKCGKLLFRTDGKTGVIEIVCQRCDRRKTVRLGATLAKD